MTGGGGVKRPQKPILLVLTLYLYLYLGALFFQRAHTTLAQGP